MKKESKKTIENTLINLQRDNQILEMRNCSFKPHLNDNRSDTSILNKSNLSNNFSQVTERINQRRLINGIKKISNEVERDELYQCTFKPKLLKDIRNTNTSMIQKQSNIKTLCQQADESLDLSKQALKNKNQKIKV